MRRPHITDKKYSTGITKISRNYDYHVDLDKYCDFLEAKHAKEPTVQADACTCNPLEIGWVNTFNGPMCTLCYKIRTA